MSDEPTDEDAEITRELRRLGRMRGFTEEEVQALTARSFYIGMAVRADGRAERAMHQTEEAIQLAREAQQIANKERQRAENAERRLRQYAALETYRRRHARNPKITLRQVCDDLGVSYANVRSLRCRVKQRKKAAHSGNTRVLQSGTRKRKKPIQ